MIDLALDASETRAHASPRLRPESKPGLRTVLVGMAGLGALGGFALAASSLMAGLAAPAPVKPSPMPMAASGRAADWPDLKDGLPALAGPGGTAALPAPVPAQADRPAETPASAARMTGLSDPVTPSAAPAQAAAATAAPTRRIPVPTPVVPIAAARQVVPLPPARVAALQPPRASETVRAREGAEPAAAPKPVAAAAQSEKPARKAVAAHKAPAAVKTADRPRGGATTAVAQAEPAAEETEVLGIKLPSLAPAGRKLKESVDALGEAVKNVF